jgi:serine/threonine-protein phosphatase CPPED1
MARFQNSQKNRTLLHPNLPQPTNEDSYEQVESISGIVTTEMDVTEPRHSFVICADSQLGMTSLNLEWETELNYCRLAVEKINTLQPRPKFVSMCGDIVDMEQSFYYNNPKALRKFETLEECESIQDKQNEDFKQVFNMIHEDIAVVCLCGNHDIGNRPNRKSIAKFRNAFGDEYLAFWTNGSYNICLNNVLFTDPTGAMDMYEEQLTWLESRLIYAAKNKAVQIFVFGHHPFFLYNEDEDVDDLKDHGSPFPKEWGESTQIFPDSYFSIPKKYRMGVIELFKKYKVSACFSGHFHQNLVSKASFGMSMIVTAPLSMVFESSGKPKQSEENDRGIRVVNVHPFDDSNDHNKDRYLGCGRFTHFFHKF